MTCHFLFICEINSVNSRYRACFLALNVCFSVAILLVPLTAEHPVASLRCVLLADQVYRQTPLAAGEKQHH